MRRCFNRAGTLTNACDGGSTSCRVTALLITQSFDSALLWAAQARLSTCATAAATARRVTALLVTQAIDNALLWAAHARLSTCSTAAATARRVTALLTTQSFDSALLWGSAGTLVNVCNGGGNSAPRDSFARHSSDRQRAALGSAARLSTCATAAATARRVTALLITQTLDSALLSAAQARSSVLERRPHLHAAWQLCSSLTRSIACCFGQRSAGTLVNA